MTNPLSWTFLLFVKERLQQITVANGYHSEVGTNVFIDTQPLDGETDEFPTLRVVEDDTDESASGNGFTDGEVRVLIESYQQKFEGQDAQLKAHKIRADIKKALPKKSKDMPVGVGSMEIVSARLIQPTDGMPFLVTQVALRARLIESNQSA